MANPPYYGKQIHGVLLLLGYPPLYRQAGTRSPKSGVDMDPRVRELTMLACLCLG
jgi:hypothetical protein